jgi:hypothetical protein
MFSQSSCQFSVRKRRRYLRLTTGRLTSREYISNQIHAIRDVDRAVAVCVSLPLGIDAGTRGGTTGEDVRNQEHNVRDVKCSVGVGVATLTGNAVEGIGSVDQQPLGFVDGDTPPSFSDTHVLRRPRYFTSIVGGIPLFAAAVGRVDFQFVVASDRLTRRIHETRLILVKLGWLRRWNQPESIP